MSVLVIKDGTKQGGGRICAYCLERGEEVKPRELRFARLLPLQDIMSSNATDIVKLNITKSES